MCSECVIVVDCLPGPAVAETPLVLHLVSVQSTELQLSAQSDQEN